MDDGSSGVLGGLPKVKPIGLPMLPADDPNAKGEGFEDGAPPNGGLVVGINAAGCSPNTEPPNTLVLDVALLSSLLPSFDVSPLNKLLEKTDGVLEGKVRDSVGLLELSPNGFLTVVGVPKVNGDFSGAGVEVLPPDEPNVKGFDFVESS